MATASTREALLEHGALLYARHGVGGVSTRSLHDAVGARNESALHYHFGSQQGLLEEILKVHLEAVERRRAVLAEELERTRASGDLRALVHALAQPMADDLQDPVGRAHLRIVAQVSHPALAFERAFSTAQQVEVDAAAGTRVVGWLQAALPALPRSVLLERLVDLRGHLISSFGLRAQLIDDLPRGRVLEVDLFVENLLDALEAALSAAPSEATLAAARRRGARRR